MQLIQLRTLFLIVAGLLCGGCMAQNAVDSSETAWHDRCGKAVGWKFCFLVPPSTHEDRIRKDFREVQRQNEKHLIFSPWLSWTGKHWDGLVADVSHARALSDIATDDQLLAWAGLWDAEQRRRDIAAGQAASSLPKPFKTRIFVDLRGRRWVVGERRLRELNLPYTRVEQKYVTPVGTDGVKLEISFDCSYPHPNCGLIDQMISGIRWEELK